MAIRKPARKATVAQAISSQPSPKEQTKLDRLVQNLRHYTAVLSGSDVAARLEEAAMELEAFQVAYADLYKQWEQQGKQLSTIRGVVGPA